MNIRYFVLIGLLIVAGLMLSACSAQTSASATDGHEAEASTEEESGHEEEGHADEEHGHMDGMTHIHAEAPEEFATLVSSVSGDAAAVAEGQEIFESTCAVCHGSGGRGDGENAVNLDPKPANLADGMMLDTLSDGYLYWRVSKGGAMEPFNSAMPAWESSLTEDQRWQVIAFIRSLPDADHDMMEEGHSEGEEMHMEEEGHD